jgi:hypothetical protein
MRAAFLQNARRLLLRLPPMATRPNRAAAQSEGQEAVLPSRSALLQYRGDGLG